MTALSMLLAGCQAVAVAKAQHEALRYGADPRRTVLGGHSAGAYIAAMLAIQTRYLLEAGVDPASIRGFFGLSGPHAVVPNTDALHAIFDAVAKPVEYQVVPQVSAQVPPALLVSHTQKLAAALRAKGVSVQLLLVPGRETHGECRPHSAGASSTPSVPNLSPLRPPVCSLPLIEYWILFTAWPSITPIT